MLQVSIAFLWLTQNFFEHPPVFAAAFDSEAICWERWNQKAFRKNNDILKLLGDLMKGKNHFLLIIMHASVTSLGIGGQKYLK